MKISIQTSNDLPPVALEFAEDATLKDLKNAINVQFGIPSKQQDLALYGHPFHDRDDLLLSTINEDLETDQEAIITLKVDPEFSMPYASTDQSNSPASETSQPTTPFMLRCMASNQVGLAGKLLLALGCLVGLALAVTASMATAALVGGGMMAVGAGMLFFNKNTSICGFDTTQHESIELKQ